MKYSQPKTSDSSTPVNNTFMSASDIQLIELTESFQEPLAVMVYGDPGSGKSRLLGSAPDPIGLVPMERKSRQSAVKMAQEMGKRIIAPEIDLVRAARAMLTDTMPEACVSPEKYIPKYKMEDAVKIAEGEMQKKAGAIKLDQDAPKCCQRCYYRWHANRSKHVAFRFAQDPDIRTIGIDTFGQLIDDMLFACYGRNERIMPLDRKTFNREVMEFLNVIAVKNLVLIHHTSTIWKDNKPTNKTKPMSSFSKIGHYVNVVVKMERDEDVAEGDGRYKLTVEDCQANASLIGYDMLTDDLITFGGLARLVYPDAPEGAWD
jgi:hypothetical protein